MLQYKELPTLDSKYFPVVDVSDLSDFLPMYGRSYLVAKGIKIEKYTVHPRGLWSDPYDADVIPLETAFNVLAELGWEYKSTYWRPTIGEDDDRSVLCFIRKITEKF